jgi:hypothetical protein
MALLGLSALGDPAQAAPTAGALHKQALEALTTSRFSQARKLWMQAYAMARDPKYLYNIARMSMELDQPVEALEHFEAFVRQVGNQRRFQRQRLNANTFIARLMRQVAVISITANQEGVRVTVDEVQLPPGPLQRSIRLRPGRHVVTAALEGHHGETRTFDLGAQTRQDITIDLKKIEHKVITKPAKLKYPLPVWLPWTALGVGLAIAAGGGGSLAVAAQKFEDFDRSVNQGSPDIELDKQGRLYRSVGIGLMATGGALAIGGLIALLLNRPKLVPVVETGNDSRTSQKRVRWRPVLGLSSVGVELSF